MRSDAVVGVVDVHYSDTMAHAALVVCKGLAFSSVVSEHTAEISEIEPYIPGELYRRELPCIRAVVELGPKLDLLVVDRYATLDPHGRPGLGAHACEMLGIPVIGVAKTPFRGARHAAEVVRGQAVTPLHVTAAGEMSDAEASLIVAGMAGPHRIPMALARADRLARRRELPLVQ